MRVGNPCHAYPCHVPSTSELERIAHPLPADTWLYRKCIRASRSPWNCGFGFVCGARERDSGCRGGTDGRAVSLMSLYLPFYTYHHCQPPGPPEAVALVTMYFACRLCGAHTRRSRGTLKPGLGRVLGVVLAWYRPIMYPKRWHGSSDDANIYTGCSGLFLPSRNQKHRGVMAKP